VFLVQLPDGHPARWLFLHRDPRADGCPYEATPDIELDPHVPAVDESASDGEEVQALLGLSIKIPLYYKRFTSHLCLRREGFQYLPGPAIELSSWSAFAADGPATFPPDERSRRATNFRSAQS
jgi:hypothetical protein